MCTMHVRGDRKRARRYNTTSAGGTGRKQGQPADWAGAGLHVVLGWVGTSGLEDLKTGLCRHKKQGSRKAARSLT